MGYEEVKLLKQSGKSTVQLVQKDGEERLFVRKILKGQHPIYLTMKNFQHPYLPKVYEVTLAEDSTTIIEEYIEGAALGSKELSEKELLSAIRELCTVLEYLHEKEIIHRDIKPSNIILAKDGHIRLIDFDAARMPKDDLEQDTRLLGTRGYAPPEQYGFSQTDARADIYALGVTLKQILGDLSQKPRYRRIIQKCTNLNPDKRYQTAEQVRWAFSCWRRYAAYGSAGILLLAILVIAVFYQSLMNETAMNETAVRETFMQEGMLPEESETLRAENETMQAEENEAAQTDEEGLVVLPAPDRPHWRGESGVGVWGNVPESGAGGEVGYYYRLYRMDSETPPDPEKDSFFMESGMRGNGSVDEDTSTYSVNMASQLQENGFYYYAVCAAGDGVTYADSPYVMSDAFEYTGESAPPLPAPTGLQWKILEDEKGRIYLATWSNLEDYEDEDTFNATVYDKDGNYVANNIWNKKYMVERGINGIKIDQEYLTDLDGAYRFTIQAYTSRPNEYRSSLLPDPIPEEYYSPWYYR